MRGKLPPPEEEPQTSSWVSPAFSTLCGVARGVNSSPRPCRDPSVFTAPEPFANGASQPSPAVPKQRHAVLSSPEELVLALLTNCD